MNKTLENAASAMIHHLGFPTSYSEFAYATLTYTRNLSPNSGASKTPYELWFGRRPNVAHLRIFGKPGYVFIPKHQRSKLASKAELYYFVGYGQLDGTKGWKMLDVNTGKTVITCDVRFLKEPKFP